MMATIVLILAGVAALSLIVIVVNRGRGSQGNAHHDGGVYYGAYGNHTDGSERSTGDWGGHSGSHDGGGYDGGWGDSGSGDSGGGDGGGGDGGGGE